jgi:putative FmdB family regulatory protein
VAFPAAKREESKMPIYEYRCAACGHELEVLQRLADAPLTVCPACHKTELRKLVSAAGFQLKGSGWYVTDFRQSGAKPAARDKSAGGDAAATGNGSAAASAGDGGGDAGTKTESKPADSKAASSTATPSKPPATTNKSDT